MSMGVLIYFISILCNTLKYFFMIKTLIFGIILIVLYLLNIFSTIIFGYYANQTPDHGGNFGGGLRALYLIIVIFLHLFVIVIIFDICL